MTTPTRPTGVYRLAQDVTNPKPDRRQKYDWRVAEQWKAGMLFEIVERRLHADLTAPALVRYRKQYGDSIMLHEKDSAALAAILPHLEPYGSPDTVLHQVEREVTGGELEGGLYREAMKVLIARGEITLLDLHSALAAAQAAAEEEN